MVTRLTDSLISVDPEQAIFLKRRSIQTIHCIERQLWLTQEGLADDIILSDGENITLRGRGLIAVQALSGRALFMVKRPASLLSSISRAVTRLIDALRRANPPCWPTR